MVKDNVAKAELGNVTKCTYSLVIYVITLVMGNFLFCDIIRPGI